MEREASVIRLQMLLQVHQEAFREATPVTYAEPTCFQAPTYACQELFFRQALAFVADVGWRHVQLRSRHAKALLPHHLNSQYQAGRMNVLDTRLGLPEMGSQSLPQQEETEGQWTNRLDVEDRLRGILQRRVSVAEEEGWFANNLAMVDTITLNMPSVSSRSSPSSISASADLVFRHDILQEGDEGENPVALEPGGVEDILFNVCDLSFIFLRTALDMPDRQDWQACRHIDNSWRRDQAQLYLTLLCAFKTGIRCER